MKRAGENRHDLERAAVAQQVLQEHGLKLDRVFLPMGQFVGEQVQLPAARRGRQLGRQLGDELAIGLDRAQRRLEMLPRDREQIAHRVVRRAEDDEQVGVALFDQSLVGPGKRRPAAVQIDVRAQHAAQPSRSRRRPRQAPERRGLSRRVNSAGQLLAQAIFAVGGYAPPAWAAGRERAVQIALDFGFPASPKAIVVEKLALVQLAHQLLDHRASSTVCAEFSLKGLLQISRQRARAVHQRGQHGRGIGQHDRAGKALGIAQCKHHFAAGLADRKALDAAQARLSRSKSSCSNPAAKNQLRQS